MIWRGQARSRRRRAGFVSDTVTNGILAATDRNLETLRGLTAEPWFPLGFLAPKTLGLELDGSCESQRETLKLNLLKKESQRERR